MGRPMHFEIQVDDLERAQNFYAEVFGWTYEDYSHVTGTPYLGVITGPDDEPGINGGMLPRTAPAPGRDLAGNAWVVTVVVDDYDAAMEHLRERGRAGVREDRTPRDGLAGVLHRSGGQHLRDSPA